MLDIAANIITTWDIEVMNGFVDFGNLSWKEKDTPQTIFVSFEVKSAKISY